MFILKKSNAEKNIHIESPLRHQMSNANIEKHKKKLVQLDLNLDFLN